MTVPQGTFNFPGIDGVLSASLTLSLGINPSVTAVSIPPKPFISRLGTAVWSFNGVVRMFPNSVVDTIQVNRSGGAVTWNLSILDRRWTWQFGQVSGEFNVPGEGGVIESTEKSPRELATICLQAMTEVGFDVSSLPENDRPYVQWDAEVPAKALAEICDQYGCAVSLTLDNRVRIVRLGEGASLPLGALSQDDTVDPVNLPSKLAAWTAPARWQVDLPCEPVGLDTDGEVKPIDSLSYKPVDGWTVPRDYLEFGHIADPKARDLAIRTVYRWFRVQLPPVTLPGATEQPSTLRQILPLIDRLVVRAKSADGEEFQEALVWGKFKDEQGLGSNNTQDELTAGSFAPELINRLNFTLDAELGVLKYSEPVVRHAIDPANRPNGALPAQLFYRCSINIRNADRRIPQRVERAVDVDPTSPAPTKYLVRNDIIPTFRFDDDAEDWVDNLASVESEADFYLNQELANYVRQPGADAEYAGFVAADLDGRIRQVTYQISGAGEATTRIAWNVERIDRGVTLREARQRQKVGDAIERDKRERGDPESRRRRK